MDFEIEFVLKPNASMPVIVARQIKEGMDFRLTDSSELGGIKIRRQFSQPRSLTPMGVIRVDVFCFFPKIKDEVDQLQVGQIISLIL